MQQNFIANNSLTITVLQKYVKM